MKKIIPIVFAIILLTGTSGASYESVFAQTPDNPTPDYQKPEKYKPDTLIVKFKSGVSAEQQNSILSAQNSSVVDDLELLKIKIISVPEPALDAVQNALSKNKSVEYAEYVEGAAPTVIPNDPRYLQNDQWYLDTINAEGAWDITKGGDFPIGILDSGIDMDHPELASKIIHPYDAENLSNPNINDMPDCGHGTGVAGNAAAATDNGVGISQIGWDTQIIPIKITQDSDPDCLGWSDAVLRGVQHAVSKGAKVVNLSYGFSGGSGHIQDAADLLRANNGWLVISAGNSGGPSNKTDYPYIIFVSSTNSNDNLSGFSSYGNYVDIASPGSSILLTTDGGGYSYWGGTSMAAPLAAATLNLLYSIDPTLTSDESFNILKNTAVDLGSPGWDQEFGHGRIDAQAAAQEAVSNIQEATGPTPENFKIAFIGDQGLGSSSELVLQTIANEGADMVLHSGDLDYAQNPDAWNSQINAFLGPAFPYFVSVGNHDIEVAGQWDGYQTHLQNRLDLVPDATCTGDLGVKSSCHYKGIFFVLSGVGTLNTYTETEYVNHIQTELANDDSVWSICSWHKNQNAMQVGAKSNAVGWNAYEACKDGGAIIASAHEHSYERTKTLTNTQTQIIDPAWTESNDVRVDEGSTFVFVSGLGGQSIRNQDRCNPADYPYGCSEWANIYTSDQGANHGALFCVFNVDGQEDRAYCYFKNIAGEVVDSFYVTSFMGTPNTTSPPNSTPTSTSDSVSTDKNNSIGITLAASDPDNDLLAYSIVSTPQNGSISGTGPYLIYTPNLNFVGNDSFSFSTNDGEFDSATATISITVNDDILPPGTIEMQILSSSDDAEQRISSGVMDLTSSDIEIGDDPGHNEDQLGGLRFQGIEVPQGATITAAYIELTADEIDTGSTSVTIRAQDSDNTSTFTSTGYNISDRPTTSASVAWNNIPSWNTIGQTHNTPDISSLVQEVVNRAGWSSGNNMAFIIDGAGSRTSESYDGSTPGLAALLHIEFETTQPNNPPTSNVGGPYSGTEGAAIALDGSGSSDSDGTITQYDWNFGDGNTGSGVSPSHTYSSAGTFTVELTVTDDDGATDTSATSATVDADTSEPITITGISPNAVQVGFSVDATISGTGFEPGASVSLSNGSGPIPTASVNSVSSDGTEINVSISTKNAGPNRDRVWDVIVTNSDSSSDTFAGGFTVTINPPNPLPSISIDDVTQPEGDSGSTDFTFTITRSGDITGVSTVVVETQGNSATIGEDLGDTICLITFEVGETTHQCAIAVNGDTTPESDETFFANLSNCTECTISDVQGLGTIIDDDTPLTNPAAPVLSSPGNTHNSIDISWTTTDDGGSPITGYTYEWSVDGFGSVLGSGNTGSNSATINGLDPTTTYDIRVYATNTIGDSENSNVVSVTTSAESAEVIITNVTPNNLSRANGSYTLTITGSGFGDGASSVTITGGSGPSPSVSVTSNTDSQITADVTLKSGGPNKSTTWTVTVLNSQSGSSGTFDIIIGP